MEPACGLRIGRYTLIRQLGRSAAVWEAAGSPRPVALRLLDTGSAGARAAARLQHPHLVAFVELGLFEGRSYLVTELLSGVSLEDLLQRGPLPLAAALEIGIQAASALAYLHEVPLSHGGLRPSRLRIEPTGLVKLVGLGTGEPGEDLAALVSILTNASRDPLELAPCSSAAELRAELTRLRARAPAGPALAELVAELRPATATPARPRLPAPLDRFHGRERELSALLDLLRSGSRLVTVHGLAGMGKSRLALEAARRMEPELRALWRVELASVGSLEGMCASVGAALGAALPGRDLVEEIAGALRGQDRALLWLDDLDALLEVAPQALARWLEAAPGVQLLCTAGAPLRIRGERRLMLGPMDELDGVGLLQDRALGPLAQPHELAALVAELDGMPLAIEIAAARLRAMSVPELRRRLGDRLRVLVQAGRDVPARHRSLQAALEASAALLGPAAREALGALAVFEGGFELGAAEAVLDPTDPDTWVPDLVAELVDASFVRLDAEGRYGLPGPVRAWARGEGGTRAEQRHGEWYAQLGGRDSLRALGTHGGLERWQALARELPNLQAAFWRAEERRDGAVAAGCALAAAAVLRRSGPGSRALELLQHAAALAPVPWRLPVRVALGAVLRELGRWPEAIGLLGEVLQEVGTTADPWLEGEVLHQLGSTHAQAGHREEALELLVRGLHLFRSLGERRMTALSLSSLGLVHLGQEPEQARQALREALVLAREVGDVLCEGVVLSNLALLDRTEGRLADARAGYEAALALHARLGHRRSHARTQTLLGALQLDLGELSEAREAIELARQAHHETGDRWAEGMALGLLGNLEQHEGRHALARAHFEEARALHHEVGSTRSEAAALGNLGELALEQGEREAALRAFEQALAMARQTGDRLQIGVWLAASARASELPAPAARQRLEEAEGLLRDGAPRLDLARLLCARAELEARLGDPGSARTALAEASDLASRMGLRPTSPLQTELERVRASLQTRPAPLEVDADGTRFRWGSASGDLASRHAIRRVLAALVDARRTTPGQALEVERLFAAGWPGERAVPEAARERVYHAIGTLRKLGLAPVLERVEGGWRLDPQVALSGP
jgi:predicted ATPase